MPEGCRLAASQVFSRARAGHAGPTLDLRNTLFSPYALSVLSLRAKFVATVRFESRQMRGESGARWSGPSVHSWVANAQPLRTGSQYREGVVALLAPMSLVSNALLIAGHIKKLTWLARG